MGTNEFLRMSQLVTTILERYHKICEECNIAENDWHRRSIDRLAKPFIQGCFTLAVVGKVSSGKSTFINALLGCKNLLPTGHDQTTCGITYIEYGENPEVIITFGDGHKEVITGVDLLGEVKKHVSIPEKFHDLPVNNIDEMILGGMNFDEIWNCREDLVKATLCPDMDDKLLKDYVLHRSKKQIAIEVHMKYPFNEDLKGWRIIDTPGIGAIGGIEGKTKHLLSLQKEDGTREVDAIIFLQDGSQTLDQTDTKKFVKEQLDNFTKEDKRRLFFVLTHSSDKDFLNHKDQKIETIKKNYGEKIRNITYADGLLYAFINELDSKNIDLKQYDNLEKLKEWDDDEWDAILEILDHAKRSLKKSNESFNNETMCRIIQEWAHFDILKSEINNFARNEKKKYLIDIVRLIATDYLGFVSQLERDYELVNGDLAKINEAIDNIELKRKQYNAQMRKIDDEFRIDAIISRFNFINTDLAYFEYIDSINEVRTAITNLFNEVQLVEKEMFNDLIRKYSDLLKKNYTKDILLESLDFGQLEHEATLRSREDYEISPKKVIKHRSSDDEIIAAKYGTRTNEETKLRNFKALSISKARQQRDSFVRQLKEKIENMSLEIRNELDLKLKYEKSHFENLKEQLGRKQEFKKENDIAIAKSNEASIELIKLVDEYDRYE